MLGQRFFRLLVVSRAENDRHHAARWLCLCDCGNTHIVSTNRLRVGNVTSCGCWQREYLKYHRGATKHGHAKRDKKSPTYRCWRNMLTRCEYPNAVGYENYGGRGIVVCERWHDFAVFLADMGEKPAGLSIDRIDVNGNYEPGNCRWTTDDVQQRNKRKRANCRNGHPYDEDTRLTASGSRVCRTCVAENARKRRLAVIRREIEVKP